MRKPQSLSRYCPQFRDPELMKIFNDPNGDVHTESSEWLGLNDRNVAKEINFAICFGMGPAALARKINEVKDDQGLADVMGEEIARSYIEGFYRRFTKVKAFFEREWEKLRKLPPQERVVRSLVGRERKFPRRPTDEIERQFRVTLTQQIEADLIKTAMVKLAAVLEDRGMKARLVMMIHDSIWIEAPSPEGAEVRDLTRTFMTEAGELDVPLEVDFE